MKMEMEIKTWTPSPELLATMAASLYSFASKQLISGSAIDHSIHLATTICKKIKKELEKEE